MNKRLIALILAVASVIGWAIVLILAVGFGAHGSPDKWLIGASGLTGALALLLVLV